MSKHPIVNGLQFLMLIPDGRGDIFLYLDHNKKEFLLEFKDKTRRFSKALTMSEREKVVKDFVAQIVSEDKQEC